MDYQGEQTNYALMERQDSKNNLWRSYWFRVTSPWTEFKRIYSCFYFLLDSETGLKPHSCPHSHFFSHSSISVQQVEKQQMLKYQVKIMRPDFNSEFHQSDRNTIFFLNRQISMAHFSVYHLIVIRAFLISLISWSSQETPGSRDQSVL